MTSAPADLLAFRTDGRSVTGLPAVEFGLAPDAAHLSSGGYHVGVEDIQRIGRWLTDYSTRQARDKLDGTNTTSAADVGSAWRNGGRAAWLRFNNLLYAEMRDRPQNLPALRAINVSLDGKTKRRFDQNSRGAGLITSTDTVDTHTHLEFWRDTEGRRGPTLDRIVQLMQAAVSGNSPAASTGDDDDMGLGTEPLTQGNPGYAGHQHDTAWAFTWQAASEAKENTDKLLAAAQADEVRDRANTAAIEGLTAALKAAGAPVGGKPIDAGDIIAAVNAVRDEARREYAAAAERAAEQDSRIADLEEQLARAVAAAEANLSPAELDKLHP